MPAAGILGAGGAAGGSGVVGRSGSSDRDTVPMFTSTRGLAFGSGSTDGAGAGRSVWFVGAFGARRSVWVALGNGGLTGCSPLGSVGVGDSTAADAAIVSGGVDRVEPGSSRSGIVEALSRPAGGWGVGAMRFEEGTGCRRDTGCEERDEVSTLTEKGCALASCRTEMGRADLPASASASAELGDDTFGAVANDEVGSTDGRGGMGSRAAVHSSPGEARESDRSASP